MWQPRGVEFICSALLCDLDGTLIDSSGPVERSWRVWAGEYGFEPEKVLAISYGRRSEDTIDELLPPPRRARALARIDELELVDLDGIVPIPGAPELVAGLDRRLWAVVTSGNRELMTARIEAAGIGVPEVLVTADDVRVGKPDPEGYLKAARLLAADPAECLVIEDAPAGVAAGKAAGARVVAVTVTHTAAELWAADAVVPDLRAVAVELREGGGPRLRVRVQPGNVGRRS